MQNVVSSHEKSVRGVAAAGSLTHELLYNFIDRVAHAFPKLTFNVWSPKEINVSDVYGNKVGKVRLLRIGRYHRTVLELASLRMEDKRNNKVKTADLNRAVKMFAKYFRPHTEEELMWAYSNYLGRDARDAYDNALLSLRSVMDEPLYNFFQTASRQKRYEFYSMLALPEAQLSAIETEALQYFDHCALLDMSKCAVLLKTPTGYLVKRPTPEGAAAAPVERVKEVPLEYRAQVGLLKLASHREFIPNVGIKLEPLLGSAVESYLCVNRQPV